MKLFEKILIETHGFCNRSCPTCLRESYPHELNREKILARETVEAILKQAKELNFDGPVGFVYFNEPLMDPRLPSFIRLAKEMGFYVYTVTNGDFLDEMVAKQIQMLDEIVIGVYDYYGLETRPAREEYYKKLFPGVKVGFSGRHITTHFSPYRTPVPPGQMIPNGDLNTYIELFKELPCFDLRRRIIITCTGEMALCCEDIACQWDLGNINDHTLEELWFSPRHQEIFETLGQNGGRQHYPYCRLCPRQ